MMQCAHVLSLKQASCISYRYDILTVVIHGKVATLVYVREDMKKCHRFYLLSPLYQ